MELLEEGKLMKCSRFVVAAVTLLAACAVSDEVEFEDDVLRVQIGDELVEESEFDAYGIEVAEADDATPYAIGELTAQPQTAEWSRCKSVAIGTFCGTQSQLKWMADLSCQHHIPGSTTVVEKFVQFCGISKWRQINVRCCK